MRSNMCLCYQWFNVNSAKTKKQKKIPFKSKEHNRQSKVSSEILNNYVAKCITLDNITGWFIFGVLNQCEQYIVARVVMTTKTRSSQDHNDEVCVSKLPSSVPVSVGGISRTIRHLRDFSTNCSDYSNPVQWDIYMLGRTCLMLSTWLMEFLPSYE